MPEGFTLRGVCGTDYNTLRKTSTKITSCVGVLETKIMGEVLCRRNSSVPTTVGKLFSFLMKDEKGEMDSMNGR